MGVFVPEKVSNYSNSRKIKGLNRDLNFISARGLAKTLKPLTLLYFIEKKVAVFLVKRNQIL